MQEEEDDEYGYTITKDILFNAWERFRPKILVKSPERGKG